MTGQDRGNYNAMKNGTTVDIRRLTVGKFPAPLMRTTRTARRYRRDLEDEVIARHGEVSVLQAHAIDAAVGHEMHAAVCRWLLCQRMDTMATSDVLACSGQIARAKEARNRAIRELGLDPTSVPGVLDSLYDASDQQDDSEHQEGAADASDGSGEG